MKTFKKLLTIACFIALAAVNSIAQTAWTDNSSNIYLNPLTGKVGIGTSSPTGKLHIVYDHATSSSAYGSYLITNNNFSGSSNTYGMRSASTSGENNTGINYGTVSNTTTNNTASSTASYGFHSTVTTQNKGEAFGYYASVKNTNSASTSAIYGMRAVASSSSDATPIYALASVATGESSLYGFFGKTTNNSETNTKASYGARTLVSSQNKGSIFGYDTDVNNTNASSTAGVYGIRTVSKSSSNASTVYGIHTSVSGGSKRWAGYFTGGDMYVSGNVGVGTTDPQAKLEVAGVIKATEIIVNKITSNEQSTGNFSTGGDMYVSGKVGIGTDSPTGKLHIVYDHSTSGTAYGSRLITNNNNTTSSTTTFGYHSTVTAQNIGESFGYYANVKNTNPASTSPIYGIRAVASSSSDAPPVYGLASAVTGESSLYGLFGKTTNNSETSTKASYGARTLVSSQNKGSIFGYDTDVNNTNTSSTAGVYGIRTVSKSSSNASTVYGIHTYVSGGSKRWAGYFTGGDMYVSGKVGIGRNDPYYKLDVAGIIRAHEIKVNTNIGADFVFEEDYVLRPLNEVSDFIQANKHLPEIPSAADMIANGLDMGEFQIKLLQKIEELTLYVIEQDKQLKEQNKQLKQQQQEINRLKSK